jgi:signal transduction histidine kinase
MTVSTPSLLLRISIRLMIVTIGAAIISYAWVFYEIRYAADSVAEGSLITQALEIVSGIVPSNGDVSFSMPVDLTGSSGEAEGRFRYSVRDELGNTLFKSSWPTASLDKVRILDTSNQLYQFHHQEPERERFFGAVLRTNIGGRVLVVQVERNSRRIETLMDTILGEFFIHGGWVGIPFLLALMLISIWTIRGAIKPLNKLSQQAETIGPGTTDLRLPLRGVPREIAPLVRAVNSALDRLEKGFSAQQELTADAAHELRTPLAVLRAHIDILPDPQLASSLREDAERMERVVSQLLRVARLDALSVGSAEIADLNEIAVAVASFMIPLAMRDNKAIEVLADEEPCFVHGNRESIFQAVRNLVENALQHMQSGKTLELVVELGCTLKVVDHGKGIPLEIRDQVFKRFWRSDRSGAGAGLGLAIVKRTMEIHGGLVSISDTPSGGVTFTLSFPPRPGADPTRVVPLTLYRRRARERAAV